MLGRHATLQSKTRWVHFVAIAVVDWWPYGISLIGTALLAVPSFKPSIAGTIFGWSVFGTALLCLIFAGLSIASREKSIHSLEESVRSAQLELDTVEGQLRKRLRTALHELMKECDLAQSGVAAPGTKSWSHLRGTVYCHDPHRRVFVRLARYSDNPHLEEGGRAEYPDSEGFISDAWAERWQHENDHSEDYATWLDEVCEDDKFPRATAEKLTMQSLSLASARIGGHAASPFGSEKSGIIVIESRRKRGAKSGTGKLLSESTWFPVVGALVKVKHALIINSGAGGIDDT